MFNTNVTLQIIRTFKLLLRPKNNFIDYLWFSYFYAMFTLLRTNNANSKIKTNDRQRKTTTKLHATWHDFNQSQSKYNKGHTTSYVLHMYIKTVWKVSKYGVLFHAEYGIIRTRKTSVFGHFSRSQNIYIYGWYQVI